MPISRTARATVNGEEAPGFATDICRTLHRPASSP